MKKRPSLFRHRGIRICALPFAALFAVSASAGNVSWSGATDAVWSTGENWTGGVAPAPADTAVFDAGSTTNLGTGFSIQSLVITTPEGLITIGGANMLTLGTGGIGAGVALQDLQLSALVALAAGQSRNGVDGEALVTSAVIHGSAVNLSRIEIADLTFSGPSLFAGAATMGGGQLNETVSLGGTKLEKLTFADFGTFNIGAAPIANRGVGEVRMSDGSGVARSANGGGRKTVKISSRSVSKTGAKEEAVITDETAEELREALKLKDGTGPLLGLSGAEGLTLSDTGFGNTDANNLTVSAASIVTDSNQNLGRQYVTTRLVPLVSPPLTGAWTGATDANWLTGTNWDSGIAPGTTDTATFNAAAGVGGATISLGAGVTVNTITFDTASAAAYTIGSGGVGAQTLSINDAGAVTMNATVASNELVNANIVLGTGAATYTFTNNSVTNTLTFAGGISGGTTGAKILSIAGAGNTAISGAIATGAGSSVALTVSGTATLGGSNTYGGATTINAGGIVNIQNGIALGTTGGTTTVNSGGALQVQGNILTLIEGLTLNGGGISNDGALRNISGVNIYNGALTLASAARIHSDAGRLILDNTTATGGNLLTFGGAGDLSAVGVISAAGGLTKEGAGTLAVFAANTYTGNSSLNGGAMLLGSAETAGTSGPLGNKAAAAAGTILFGGGALQFSPQNANDYSGRFSTAGGQAIKIDTNSRSVTFATNITGAGTSFTKTGFGTLTLGGAANTYDGGTTISGGTLLATAAGNLPSSGTLTVNGGGTFSAVNGTADTGYVTNKLTLANSATLAFDWAGASADKLTSTTAATTSGIIGINLTPAAPSGTSTLISAASGLSGASYFLANNTNYTAALTPGDTAITVGSFASVAALTNAYWVGNKIAAANTAGVDNAMALSNGTISNWSSAAAYAATGLVPGSTANVIFSVTSGDTPTQQGNIVLGSDMSVNSVTFNDTTPVIINGSNALTLLSTGTGAASAISTNQDFTINAGVILGATQTWTTAATKTLTLGGNIGNVTAGAGLTIAGTGTTQINGTAAYSGSTTVNNGATLTFAAGSRKTYLGAGNTLVVTGVVNVAGDVDVHSLGGLGLNGVINVPATGALTIRSAEGNQDQNAGIGNGGYGMLNITGGAVSVLASGGAPGSMNMENGGSQALLRITSGVLNAGTMMIARNGGGTSELTITGGTYNKPGGSFNLGDRGGFTTVLNVAGGLIDNTNQTLTWGRSGATAGAALIVANFDAGTILTKEFGVSGQAGFQIIANYNGGTIKVSPGVNANFYNGTQGASSSFMSYVNGAFGAFNGGIVMDTNGSSTALNANLLAPTGNGITTLSLASGGSGYTGAPIVTISDSGTTQSGTTASASNTITMANTTGVFVGQSITGTGIPAGSIVTAVSPNTSISISQNVTAAGSPTLTFKGQGATAYANVSGGAVTGFIVTNPGVGYVGTVTATLGGGSGTAATLNAITPVANSSGGLIKNGLGTLTLSGANTFSGAIAVNTGTLAFGQPLGITNTYGSISGSGAISQTGAGTTILSAANTYAGVTTLTAGVLALTNANALPGGIGVTGGTSALTFSGGVLGLGFENYTRNLGVAGDVTAANFTGAGGWAAYGADRTVNIGGASATITWGTANTGFNGQTIILSNATATHTIEVLNPLDLGNTARTVQVDNGAAIIDGKLSGLLSGTGGGITKTGLGMLTLTNASNSYTGATTVNGGILVTNVSGTLPGGSNVTVSGTGANVTSVLDLAGNSTTIGTLTFGGSTTTSAALLRTGAGTLTLGGDVTYANGGSPLGAMLSGNLSLGATRTFTINDSATTPYDLTVSANISGSGVGITKAQTGTLLLSGANSYSGATIVNAGTLQSANEGALSSTPSVTVNNAGSVLAVSYGGASDYTQAQVGTLLGKTIFSATTTALGFDTTNATSAATYGSVLSMPAGVSKLGSGTLNLSGNNSYSGSTTVIAGTLILSGTNSGTGTATISGGVLRANDGVGLNASSVLTINGGVFETGADIVRNGGSAAGNMQITGGNSGFSANGGPVNVAFGGLATPTALTWGNAPFAVGTLILNGPTANNTLDFKNAVNLNGARTVQVDASVATMSGILSNGSLNKTGAGTLVLTGINTNTGTTSVQFGTLTLNGATGSLVATTALNLGVSGGFTGGAFNYDNVGATGATTQTFSTLATFNNGPHDNTVQVTRTAAQDVTLAFTGLTNNTTEQGNVVNFVTKDTAGGGVNGTGYKITLGSGLSALIGVGAASYFNITSQNAYFNGSDFAVYDPAGFVRGVKYATDSGAATSAGATFTATLNQEMTASVTGQGSISLGSGTGLGSLKIVGASDLTMQAGATLTFNAGGNVGVHGLLKTGGGTSTISGGTAINLGNTQGDIRVDGPTDILNINMPVTFSATTRLLKSGLGTLILSNGTFAMTDGNSRNRLFINGGIMEIGGNALMNDTSSTINLASGTLLKFSSSASSFVGGNIAGLGALTVSNGVLTLTNAGNSYTAATTLDGGILNITSLANGGAGSGIGASSNAAGNLLFGGGTLQHTGSTAAATDRLFTIGTASGNSATLDASGTTFVAAMTFSNLGPIAFGNTNAHTLTLTGTNVAENTFAPAIGDNVGATSVVKNGVNTWTLTGTNSYSGGTTINAGTLNVIGVTPLGATTGTLAVNNANTGAGRSVVLNLSTTAPTTTGSLSGTIATPSSGTNTVTINNGGKLFTVNQTTPGTYAGAINGSGGFTLGGSALTLTGASNYSGATSVNAGTLALTGSGSLGNTAISVAGGATFAARPGSGTVTAGTSGAGTNGASLSLSAGSAFTMADDAIGTFNLQQNSSYASDGLLINVASGSVPTLTFDIGNGTIDLLNVSRGVTTNVVLGQINFAAITGLTSLTPGSYPFITAASGLGASLFTLANSVIVVGSNAYNLSLSNSTTTQEILTITPNGGSGPIQSFVRTTPASPLNARPGAAISMTATLSNVGTGDLDANLSSTGVLGVTELTSSSDPVVNGTPASITGTINTGATAGTQSWQVTNTDALALNTTVSIGGTVSVYDLANAKYTGAALAFGNLHKLASAGSQSVAFGNQTVTSASFQDLLNVSATTGNASVTAAGFTGLAPSTNGIATSNLTFSVSTATAGSLASAPTLTLTSNANGVAGLSNGTATVVGSPSAITITGQVYSGLMIWDGASGGNWNTDANWNDSQSAAVHAPPGLDGGFTGVDIATFGNTSGSVTVNLSGASPSLNAITFNSTGSYTIAGASAIKLAGTTPSITSTGTQIISAPLTLGSNLGVTVGGGTLTLSGAIGQSGSFSLTKFGAGTLVLGGTNTFTGATTLSAGTLSVGAGENLGNANALIFDGGTLQITGTALTAYAAGLIGSHAVTLSPDKTAGFDIASAAHTFTISQPLTQGIGGLIKSGPGTLDLVGANTYTGDTNVNAGTLAVNGTISGSTVVNSGGTLAGNNSTGAMGNVTVNSGGTFAPGGSTTGALNTGTLTFATGSIFGFEIDTFTPAIDFVSITGDLNITSGAIFNASDLANVVLPEGTVVPAIIDYSGTWNGGTFNGLADDSIFMIGVNTYQISYNGLDGVSSEVTLSVVPEPGVAISLLGGLGLLLGARRRRA